MFVVVIGLIPILVGGPAFALLLTAIGWAGFREFLRLASVADSPPNPLPSLAGYVVIVAIAAAALLKAGVESLFAIVAFAAFGPLVLALPHTSRPSTFFNWSLICAGSLYLAVPVYAAIALRSIQGSSDVRWLSEWSASLALGWASTPRGLAWTLLVVLAIWVGDSAAYLTGRTYGRRLLAPQISPGKTIEGAIGGLLGAAIVGGIVHAVFGLGVWWLGAIIGGIVGVAGQLGDLCESFLKRQAGVKDSGTLIPGHGGMLDRVDALLVAFPVGFLLAVFLGSFGLS